MPYQDHNTVQSTVTVLKCNRAVVVNEHINQNNVQFMARPARAARNQIILQNSIGLTLFMERPQTKGNRDTLRKFMLLKSQNMTHHQIKSPIAPMTLTH